MLSTDFQMELYLLGLLVPSFYYYRSDRLFRNCDYFFFLLVLFILLISEVHMQVIS